MKKLILIYILIIFVSPGFLRLYAQPASCDTVYDFQNPDLPLEVRMNDLMDRLTIDEKISQLNAICDAIPRLGIPAYTWWNEALHGTASRVGTVFPQVIGLAATFDKDLIFQIGAAISDEARAQFQATPESNRKLWHSGLTFWSPNINIFRDPRWGRGQETWGEDPLLTGEMASMFVRGMQGNDPKYLKTVSCAKHFAVHSGPESVRHSIDIRVSEKDMAETYLPAFKSLVDAGVGGVMCAYNSVNGEPCCGNNELLSQILRKDWGFKGYVVSDCGAIGDIYRSHHYEDTPEKAAAWALKGGVSLNCGDMYVRYLKPALKDGLITETDIDTALRPLLEIRFRLGLFDPPGRNPYEKISPEVINSEAHRQLARKAAREGVVMLKNNGVLPVDDRYNSFYVIGPTAADMQSLLSNYNGNNPRMSTIMEGIASKIKPGQLMEYKMGTMLTRKNVNPIDWFSGSPKNYDICFAVFGINTLLEGEEGESYASPDKGDRQSISLPPHQLEYLKKIRKDNPKPLVVILTGGSPISVPELDSIADAILFVWYPGEEGGDAVADVLWGEVSPSGKLPVTFPRSVDQLPPFDDYSMNNRTYRYMKEEPLYPFGFGLSYTKFSYSDLKISKPVIQKGDSVEVSVNVRNKGDVKGNEVVQFYIKDVDADVRVPVNSLIGFDRVSLKPGESKIINFTVQPRMMELVDEAGNRKIEKGVFEIFAGGVSPGKRGQELGAPPVLKGEFRVR